MSPRLGFNYPCVTHLVFIGDADDDRGLIISLKRCPVQLNSSEGVILLDKDAFQNEQRLDRLGRLITEFLT